MKNFYIAYTIQKDNRFYSSLMKVSTSDNLLSKIEQCGKDNIAWMSICETKKHCQELVKDWNGTFKQNKTYLFGRP